MSGNDQSDVVAERGSWPLVLVLLTALAIAFWAGRLPTARDAIASPTAFSAGRAMAYVQAIAVRPHPIGSAAIDATRDYIVDQAKTLGLETRVLRGTGVTDLPRFPFIAAGSVQDIAATVPGADRTLPAIILMAHYDTVPLSAGSGDDTAGVATLLETARALKAGRPLARDVILLFTEGEEAGLLGSSMYFAGVPRDHVGTVLNFEARGTGGRVLMFQVSPHSGDLIRLYASRASLPSADSLVPSLYKYMPNDTDLTSALGHGYAGLNFAFADRQVGYHTPMATPPLLEQGSLQHMGDQALSMTSALAARHVLPGPSDDLAYADIYGTVLAYYPAAFGWVLIAIAAGALVLGGYAMRRRGELTARAATCGVALAFTVLFVGALWIDAGFHLAGWLERHIGGDYTIVGNFSWFLAGSAALAAAATATPFVLASRNARPLWPCLALVLIGALSSALAGITLPSLVLAVLAATALAPFLWLQTPRSFAESNTAQWLGLTGTLLLFAITLQALIPTGAQLFVWSALIAALLIAIVSVRIVRPKLELLLIVLIASLAFAYLATRANNSFVLVGALLPQTLALYAELASAVLFVLLQSWTAQRHAYVHVAAVAGFGLVCCMIAGARRPGVGVPTEAFEVADLAAGHAWRASYLTKLDPWALATLSRGGEPISHRSVPPFFPIDMQVAPAPTPALQHPLVVPQPTNGDGRLALLIVPRNGGRALQIALRPTSALTGLVIEGVKAQRTLPANTWSQIVYSAVPREGLRLSFIAASAGAVEVRTLETVDRWPVGQAPPAPPAGLLPFRLSNSTLVLNSSRYAWKDGTWQNEPARRNR